MLVSAMESSVVRWWQTAGALLLIIAGSGCDGLLKNDELPQDVTDPAITRTREGALAAYNGVRVLFREVYAGRESGSNISANVVALAGALSDEIEGPIESARHLPEVDEDRVSDYSRTFSKLQRVRGQARQAIALLTNYASDERALAAHVYALEGYAEVFLAELFCSGIPLSTLDYEGGYTLRPGLTTDEVFRHAAALFDSALALAGDSVHILYLAQIGKARSLLGRGQHEAAATVIDLMPDDYRYLVSYADTAVAGNLVQNFAFTSDNGNFWDISVPEQEGINGLDYRTSGDPRVQVSQGGLAANPYWHPDMYSTDGSSPVKLASGVEARLIEAEAQLQAGDGGWLTTLNALRTDGTFEIVDSQAVTDTTVDDMVMPPDTTIDTTSWTYDTLWHAGTGGTDGLAPLTDPDTNGGRVDLLFRERAFWLFLSGIRQGDLRRLIRQYGRLADEVYPVGPYHISNSGFSFYGSDVTLPIPAAERVSNPLFTGCASRGA